MRIGRRRFVQGAGVAGLGLLAGCGRVPWQTAPESPTVRRIAFLPGGASGTNNELLAAFRQQLQDLGWVEGRNLTIEVRYAAGRTDLLPDVAAELIALNGELIATAGGAPTLAVRAATATLPIVQVGGGGDLVASGLIATFGRPAGNVTGVTDMGAEMVVKRLDVLEQTVPNLSRVGILRDSSIGVSRSGSRREAAAQILGLDIQELDIAGPGGVDGAFDIAVRDQVNGLVVVPAVGTLANMWMITERTRENRLPAIYDRPGFVAAGGLMAYGPSFPDIGRRGAHFVDRILRGTKPADLPVEQPMRFDFVINLKTAQALGLTIPQHVLLQTTEVIQ
jgi:putative ABC transport system substrate-binding protein